MSKPYQRPVLIRELIETAACLVLGLVFVLVVSIAALALGAK